MNEPNDQQLLQEYLRTKSEAAFSRIVHRYLDLVYSAALRQVTDRHTAQDVAQTVFVALAQHAPQLGDRAALAGWLHGTARNLAIKTIRTDARRRVREQEAALMNEILSNTPEANWEYIAPHLDEALSELNESDRDAVLLRYFKNHDLRTVGATLGISDDAAQKRVSRAVERLREFFAKRGVTVGASGLVIAVSANAVQAAPAGLALTISTTAVLTGTIATANIATHTTMNWLTIKTIGAIAAAALTVGTGTYLLQQREANRLRTENLNLAAANLAMNNERDVALSNATAMNDELERLRKQQEELLRLRSEAGALRRQSKAAEKLAEENRKLRSSLAEAGTAVSEKAADPDADPLKQAAIAKMNDSKALVLGLIMYANDNQDQFPTDFNQNSSYWANANPSLTGTNQFELVIQGSITNVAHPSETIAVREKEAWFANGKWFKTYGFVDGHSEVHTEADGNFAAWEKQRSLDQQGHSGGTPGTFGK